MVGPHRRFGHMTLSAGTVAPDFSLPATPDQRVSLHEFRGRPVVLAFYPADWSPVCGDQLALYNELRPEFHRFNAELIGISVDGSWCRRRVPRCTPSPLFAVERLRAEGRGRPPVWCLSPR